MCAYVCVDLRRDSLGGRGGVNKGLREGAVSKLCVCVQDRVIGCILGQFSNDVLNSQILKCGLTL